MAIQKVLLKDGNNVIIPVVNELTNHVNGVDVSIGIDANGNLVSTNAQSISFNVRPQAEGSNVLLQSDIEQATSLSGGLVIGADNKIRHKQLYAQDQTAQVRKTTIDKYGHVRAVAAPNKLSIQTISQQYDELSDTYSTSLKTVEYDGNKDIAIVGGTGVTITSVGNTITINAESQQGIEGEVGYRAIFAPTQDSLMTEQAIAQVISPSSSQALTFSTDFIMKNGMISMCWTDINEEIKYN